MAKQKGIIKLDGTIGDITFYKTADGYLAKENVTISAERIATDPVFQRTRENGQEFGRAGKAGKLLRNAIRSLLLTAKDNRVTARLTKEMMKVIKADLTSVRGQRNVLDGELELLQDFDFNINARLETTLFAPFTTTVNRVAGTLTVNIPAFTPTERIAAPDGTTHFNLVSMATEIDFENGIDVTNGQESGIMPWDGTDTGVINMVNTVTAGTTHPLFLLVGVQFYQLVNGVNYPLKNGSYNALKIVKVDGV